ncbi:MAG: saccharopine dehydrogenase NADP-binding domain-containing protein, partial [Candidatus Njordarchaeales archaeon]
MNVYILGSGAIGTAIAHYLSARQRKVPITVVDINEKNLARLKSIRVETIRADILKERVWDDIAKNAVLVIDTLPSKFGFLVFKRAINLGIDIIDVTYMKEDPLILNNRAKEKGII